MEVNDDDSNFIRRPPPTIIHSNWDDSNDSQGTDSRPGTPPNDPRANVSLGLITSTASPPYRKMYNMKLAESPRRFAESPRSFIRTRFGDLPYTSTPNGTPGVLTPRARTAPLRMQRAKLSLSLPLSQVITSPKDVVNPFSPIEKVPVSKRPISRPSPKRLLLDVGSPSPPLERRPRLSDFNLPRFKQEFMELEVIGSGEYGCVTKCLSLINGMLYAVKRGLKPTANERLAHNEVYAHAVLEHPNIVRNYSSWSEDGHLYMQNEYCNGGSLEEEIKKGPMDEKHLRRVLEHVCHGLRFIHSKNLAHMDIKPGNIFIHRGEPIIKFYKSIDHDDFSEDDETDTETVYKIGDLGHVTKLDDATCVNEGDCRYIPREILKDDYSNLPKVDMFALGLTLYEAAGGGPLPKNGDEWHAIRDGKITQFSNISHELNSLMKAMIHPNPEMRPSAEDILTHLSSSPVYKSVKDKHELKASKQKIQVLEQRLEDMVKCVKRLRDGHSLSKRDVRSAPYPITRRTAALLNNNNNNTTNNNNNNKGERHINKKAKRSLKLSPPYADSL